LIFKICYNPVNTLQGHRQIYCDVRGARHGIRIPPCKPMHFAKLAAINSLRRQFQANGRTDCQYRMIRLPIASKSHGIGAGVIVKHSRVARQTISSFVQPCPGDTYRYSRFRRSDFRSAVSFN